MIIGRGMIAKAFSSYSESESILIFASGVSNSLQNNQNEFEREKKLLEESIENNPNFTLVYFGTCSVNDPELSSSPYVNHKKEMEELIKNKCSKYFIFRLSQVVGESNSPTLINFIVDKVKNKESFNVWKNSTRNLIDVEDVFRIADYLIKNEIFINQITNIASPISLSIFNIVNIIEDFLMVKGNYGIEERGGSYDIDVSKITSYFEKMQTSFNKEYPAFIIKKYYFNTLV